MGVLPLCGGLGDDVQLRSCQVRRHDGTLGRLKASNEGERMSAKDLREDAGTEYVNQVQTRKRRPVTTLQSSTFVLLCLAPRQPHLHSNFESMSCEIPPSP